MGEEARRGGEERPGREHQGREADEDERQREERRADRRGRVPRAEQHVRDVTVRHRAHQAEMDRARRERGEEHEQGAAAAHDDLATESAPPMCARTARRGAVTIAKRIASPSGPPVAKVRDDPSSNGAPNRCAVA